jgi:predicted metal-dependent hydrolase
MSSLTVDHLHFELRGSAHRRTLQVTIDRDGELVLYVPPDCDIAMAEEFVREKRPWIYKKLAEKEALAGPVAAKQYVNGEGFPYLGRNYRLLLLEQQSLPVKLEAGRFRMRRSAAPHGRKHMINWYTSRAQPWLEQRARRLSGRVGVAPPEVLVRDLGYRWGSCARGGRVNFHWKIILLPPRMVEYVVAHELVHLREVHHTPEFWLRLERTLPDFADRKQWLAARGGAATAV